MTFFFFTGVSNVMDRRYFSQKQWFEVKNISMDLFITNTHIFSSQCICGEGGVVQRSLQREKDSGDSGK